VHIEYHFIGDYINQLFIIIIIIIGNLT